MEMLEIKLKKTIKCIWQTLFQTDGNLFGKEILLFLNMLLKKVYFVVLQWWALVDYDYHKNSISNNVNIDLSKIILFCVSPLRQIIFKIISNNETAIYLD